MRELWRRRVPGDKGKLEACPTSDRFSRVFSEPDPVAFAPESNNYNSERKDDRGGDGHCPAIADGIAEFRLAISDRARQQHSALVCESGQKASDRIGRQFSQVGWYDTPCPL